MAFDPTGRSFLFALEKGVWGRNLLEGFAPKGSDTKTEMN
jgi:hypothetical protein